MDKYQKYLIILKKMYDIDEETAEKVPNVEDIPVYSSTLMDCLADEGTLDAYLDGEMSEWDFRRAVEDMADRIDMENYGEEPEDDETRTFYEIEEGNVEEGVPPTLNVFTNIIFDDPNVEILPTNLDEAPVNSFASMKLDVHDADDDGRKMSLPRIPVATKKAYVDAVNEYCKEIFLRK